MTANERTALLVLALALLVLIGATGCNRLEIGKDGLRIGQDPHTILVHAATGEPVEGEHPAEPSTPWYESIGDGISALVGLPAEAFSALFWGDATREMFKTARTVNAHAHRISAPWPEGEPFYLRTERREDGSTVTIISPREADTLDAPPATIGDNP